MRGQVRSAVFGDAEFPVAECHGDMEGPILSRGQETERENLMGRDMGDIQDVAMCPLPWDSSHRTAYF